MALDTRSEKVKKIKRIVKIVFILIVAILIFWAKTYPHRSALIMTDSSHEMVEYIDLEKNQLGQDKIDFALYDDECGCYQVCIANGRIFDDFANLMVYVDGKEFNHSVMRVSNIWKDHTIIFLDELPKYREFTIRYLDDTAAVYWNK